jgi:hypothetical protein
MKPTKYSFSLFLLFIGAMHNAYALENSPQIQRLLNEKQKKIEELEKCDGKRKGFMIAGISTIGLTAVGVGVNIAQANKSNQLSEQINAQNTELKQQQDKISDINKEISQRSAEQKRTACESDGLHVYVNGICHDKAQYECTQLGKVWVNGTCQDRHVSVSSQLVNTAPANNNATTGTVTNTPTNSNTPTSTVTTTTTTNGNHITSTVTTTTITTTKSGGTSGATCSLNFDALAQNMVINRPIDLSACNKNTAEYIYGIRNLEKACYPMGTKLVLKSDNRTVAFHRVEAVKDNNSFTCKFKDWFTITYQNQKFGELDKWEPETTPSNCNDTCNQIKPFASAEDRNIAEGNAFPGNRQCLKACAPKVQSVCNALVGKQYGNGPVKSANAVYKMDTQNVFRYSCELHL